jgi:hypothetical protein
MIKRTLAVLPAAVAMALSGSGAAWAAPVADVSEGTADVLSIAGHVTFSGDTASVSFVYKCTGEPAAVWASIKQLEDPRATAPWTFETHGTSGQSDAWYDMHGTAPCHGNKATRMTVQMTRADFSASGGPKWEQLENGVGYVQLCLTQGGGETRRARRPPASPPSTTG